MPTIPRIYATGWPDGSKPTMDFLESSFFNEPGKCLPTPMEVRAFSVSNHYVPRPPPVRFEHLNLIVRFGSLVTVAEAQCLWVIKKVLHDIPVPEVYGWQVDGHIVFIYMQLIRGETLIDIWSSLSTADKSNICNQLHYITSSLRHVEQDPNDPFIGSINRRHLLDVVFEGQLLGGPFSTVKEFNDWFSQLPWLRFPMPERIQDPFREFWLHRGNIIVSATGPPRILAIVDWAHCGWYPDYPDYWEYCKAAYTSWYNGEWRNKWIPMFSNHRLSYLRPLVNTHTHWELYENPIILTIIASTAYLDTTDELVHEASFYSLLGQKLDHR